jgi:flagellar motor switch protein FliM
MTLVDDTQRQVRPYDFQHQEGLERGRLRRLTPVLEVVAHRVAGSLTSVLHTPVRVQVGELEQQRWEHFANELPEPTFLTGATVSPFGGRIVLHLPTALAFALVEIRLGGSGAAPGPDRQLTEIEQRLVGEVAVSSLEELPLAFAAVVSFSLGAMSSVTSPMLMQAAKPTEMCLTIGLNFDLGDGGAHDASICVPLSVLLPMLDSLERINQVQSRGDSERVLEDIRARLLDAPIEARICFPDFALSSAELSSLVPGDVLGLGSRPGSALSMRVGDAPYCDVLPTAQGKRLACIVVDTHEESIR